MQRISCESLTTPWLETLRFAALTSPGKLGLCCPPGSGLLRQSLHQSHWPGRPGLAWAGQGCSEGNLAPTTRTQMRTHAHTHTHTLTLTLTHTRTHTHAHIHTCTPSGRFSLLSGIISKEGKGDQPTTPSPSHLHAGARAHTTLDRLPRTIAHRNDTSKPPPPP